MDRLLYLLARGLIALLQAFPLLWVARFGRGCGELIYWCDARHRRVARRNLTMCFGGEKTPDEIRALARENFRRIGENFACAIKTASMSLEQLRGHMHFVGVERVLKYETATPVSRVFAIGHFGNFELYAHLVSHAPSYRGATTYRALNNPDLNRLLLQLRAASGCLFFERRTDGHALRAALRDHHLLLGLLADQHSGDHGLRLPFFGHECNTTKAPAIFALRFNLPLHTAFCFRSSLGQWRIEMGDEIPTHELGQPRTPAAIMLDVNRAFEQAVRRDPANWFWVHNRWKQRKARRPTPKPSPEEAEPV
jgi:lauroyl/myristoyl acyltransferase